jgi:hypothetical protein
LKFSLAIFSMKPIFHVTKTATGVVDPSPAK